ncbi:MAG: MFS transporter, partial [Bacteroidales bacterium]|nr:MFS transporter [Bacteroidales bacterium]
MTVSIYKEWQYIRFCAYGFLKNLRFHDAFIVLFLLSEGISYTGIGLLVFIREVSIVILEVPSGIVADAVGRRRTLAGSFVLYALSFFMFFVSGSFVMFAFAMILFAVGDSFRTGVHKAMIYEYLRMKKMESHKTDYYGRTRAWSQTGTAVSSLLAAAFVIISGEYQTIFLLSVVPNLMNFALILSYPKALEGEMNRKHSVTIKQKFREVFNTFIQAFRSRKMNVGLVNTALHSGYYKGVKDFLQPVLQSLALALPLVIFIEDEKQTAIIIGITYFIVYLATAVMSRQSGRFAGSFSNLAWPINITLFLGLLAGFLSGIAFHIGFFALATAFFILILLIENLRKPIGLAYIADNTDQKVMSGVLSVESQVGSLFAGIFAIVVGFLADTFGVGMALSVFTI